MDDHQPKRKRKHKPTSKPWIRSLLILLIAAPTTYVAINSMSAQNVFRDGISIAIMLTAAVYIVYQAALWVIAAYLGLLDDDASTPQEEHLSG